MKILIVEDEIIIREGIARLLKKLHSEYEVVGMAENGEEGLELARETEPDIVITDIRMQTLDGLGMLQQMYREGIAVKAIVISAYSEFEYARTAMKMGVTEYLIKPVTPSALSQAMENVCHQIEQETMRSSDLFSTLELVFQNLISGTLEAEDEVLELLNNRYHVDISGEMILLCVYLGDRYRQLTERERRSFVRLCTEQKLAAVSVLESSYHQSLLCMFYNCRDAGRIGRWIQQVSERLRECFAGKEKGSVGLGWTQTDRIEALKDRFEALLRCMDWNIIFEEVVISYPKITAVQTVPCTYPFETEKRMKAAICANDWKAVRRLAAEFQNYFRTGKVYEPKEMKECYVRFLWAVIAVAKEIGCIDYKNLKQAQLLEQIMGAKTGQELTDAVKQMMEKLQEPKENEETVTHLTIKRATEMIHEYYQSGITLEEIASALNMTPEYLGTCFHREMGINFSAYIRNFRMDKAKELLCKTQLKLYEIAEQVGYANPKYFSQVFKEYTGQLPLDYRKTYR